MQKLKDKKIKGKTWNEYCRDNMRKRRAKMTSEEKELENKKRTKKRKEKLANMTPKELEEYRARKRKSDAAYLQRKKTKEQKAAA